ncbi:unnamed protein product [Mytilus coruscus]|uniref:Uncharacterized protein n=1 Tax=Mytilus coruscus TaxID=42192 RepID=A0A6J8CP15_MYTCO|nr:unnamed protein product [Mytilus coruscus]
MALYSTPHRPGTVNFGLDSQREMDHRDVVKGFRSGSSIKSIIPRMSIIDELGQAHLERNHIESKLRQKLPFSVIKNTDLQHVIPTAELILRRNGLETDVNIIPYNVYATKILCCLLPLGHYNIRHWKEDLPKVEEIIGPKPLVDRVKKSKGTVICRTKFKQAFLDKTEKDIAEEKRVKKVTKLTKNLDHLSSTMNACQAIVKPDCTKPKVLKAAGIQQALLGLLLKVVDNPDFQVDNISLDTVKEADYEKLSAAKLAWIRQKKSPPTEIMQSVKVATIEFAGVKFKCKVPSGTEYLNFVEKAVLKPTLGMLPRLKRLVEAITSTLEGKIQISTYLAKHADKLKLNNNITLDFDSEYILQGCQCEDESESCQCKRYAVPLRCKYSEENGFESSEMLTSIHQTKSGEAVMSIVTSGDIDAVVIHLFALSRLWPRKDDSTFKIPVYVFLQKPGKIFDLYCITRMLEVLEKQLQDKHIGIKIALALCLGGNDFIQNFMECHIKDT